MITNRINEKWPNICFISILFVIVVVFIKENGFKKKSDKQNLDDISEESQNSSDPNVWIIRIKKS